MENKEKYSKNAELSAGQNNSMIEVIINNAMPVPGLAPENKPLDRVKLPTEKKRSRERER